MPADTANLARAFAAQHGYEPRFIAEAPGRVNLIGAGPRSDGAALGY